MNDPSLALEIRRLEGQYAAHPGSLLFARLADLHRKAGDLDRALSVVEEGLREHPDYLSAHIVHARTLEDRGRDVQARAAYRAVLDLDAQNLVALGALGRLAETSGDRKVAAEWYERLLAVDPRNEEAEAALERLSESPGAGAGPCSEPEAEAAPEVAVEAEPEALEARPEEETAGEPEAPSGAEGAGAFGTEWEKWPGVGESGPTDAFGLEADVFELEAEAPNEARPEPVGSSGWPWHEESEPKEPEPEEPEPQEREPEELSVSEGAAADLWPEWGGEPVEAGYPWDESGGQQETPPASRAELEEPGERVEPERVGIPDAGAAAFADVQHIGVAEVEEAEVDEAEVEEAGVEEAGVEEAEVDQAEVDELGLAESEDVEPGEPVAVRAEAREGEPDEGPVAEEAPVADLPTETLATLYATQGLYQEAVTIYEELVRRRPQDEALAERLRAAREELGTDAPEAAGSSAPEESPVREHLRALLRGEAVPDAASGPDHD